MKAAQQHRIAHKHVQFTNEKLVHLALRLQVTYQKMTYTVKFVISRWELCFKIIQAADGGGGARAPSVLW